LQPGLDWGVKGMNEPITIESLINQHIHNQLEEKLPRVVSEKLKQIAPPPVWMTEKQLAEYWQLRTPDGEVTVHSIRKWTTRPENEHPLPCGSMGEKRRSTAKRRIGGPEKKPCAKERRGITRCRS
jgi:hypothetical protein